LRGLFASLLRCRRILEHLQQPGRDGAIAAKYDLATGGEAVAVAATSELRAEDTVAASPRNISAGAARGVPARLLLTGTENGTQATEDPVNFGTGMALMHKLQGKQNIVVALCGPLKESLDSWNQALKFAGNHRLPVVYVVESSAAERQDQDTHPPYLERISFAARDHRFPGIVVDGQDVVAAWRVAQESIFRARSGSGPTLIDCRMDLGRDPLQHLEHYMRERDIWDDAWREGLDREAL